MDAVPFAALFGLAVLTRSQKKGNEAKMKEKELRKEEERFDQREKAMKEQERILKQRQDELAKKKKKRAKFVSVGVYVNNLSVFTQMMQSRPLPGNSTHGLCWR